MKKLISFLNLAFIYFYSIQVSALDHQELMWGVQNQGQKITIDLNPLQTYRLQGIAHQDINRLPEVKGRKVKVAVIDTGIDITHPDLKDFIFKNSAAKCQAYEKFRQCLKKAEENKSSDSEQTQKVKVIPQKNSAVKNVAPQAIEESKSEVLQCRDEFLQAEENIYPADCFGWSVLDQGLRFEGQAQPTPNNIIGRPDFIDPAGHGTHVAGTILSVTKNIELIPVQVIGIGPNQPLKPYSVDLAPSENTRNGFQNAENLSERVARGIIYAMNTGAEVMNLSLGWPEIQNSEIIRDAIKAAQDKGIIIVAAAGNDSTSAILRPCQFKNVICVAAHRPDGALASFSNFGFGVDIAAPGVEILSTIPFTNSSIRLPGFKGYDYLSGTSQATPFVTGVIAEMLSRGIPAKEIYPRLILGARPVLDETPVIRGPINSAGVQVNTKPNYKKTILSGLIDMQRSMAVKSQPLILSADKETQVIEWNRSSANLSFKFKLKNYWQNLENKEVSVQLRSTQISEIEPAIVKVDLLNKSKSWRSDEEREVQVSLQIRDSQNPALSRMPSELSYQVYVMIDNKVHRQFEVKAEVIAIFNKDIVDPDVKTLPIIGSIPQGLSLLSIDEIYDQEQKKKDYFLIGRDQKDKKSFNLALFKMVNDRYEIGPVQNIVFNGNLDLWRPQYEIRMDIDGDGVSEYILGVIEYLDKELTVRGPYRNHFYIFDQNMNLKKAVLFDDQRLALPIKFYWMKIGQNLRPAWVAKGPEIKKKWDITDLWGVETYENVKTNSDIRFFYLDENFKLAQVDSASGTRIADVIQPTYSQAQAGVLPVLIAKNSGTELRPSYLNEFTIGEVKEGQILRTRSFNQMNANYQYRNLVDTNASTTYSLDTSATEFKGTIWYGFDAHQKQRVTLIDLEQQKIYDSLINSQREIFDAPLQIRAGFQSATQQGVFLITNSEIEYHDLVTQQIGQRSLNRFSFYGEDAFIELHNPITILDRQQANKKWPGLFTTEGTGISKGIKMMVPLYTKDGKIQKIVSPARLSFKAAKGCRTLGTPVFMGQDSGYAIDYYCGDQMKRLLLKY